jgi:biopolymer transport protein ExbD
MAEIVQNEGGGKSHGKRRAKKHPAHIDMTPMVDLMCLLLAFFMLTTAFSKPKVMEIILPDKNNTDPPPQVKEDLTYHIILDENDRVFWYNGIADPRKPPLPTIYESNFSKDGIRKFLLDKNEKTFTKVEQLLTDVETGKIVLPRDSVNSRIRAIKGEYKDIAPIVLIKATEKAKYGNMVDVIDEMAITNIATYAIVDISPVEVKMVEEYKATHENPNK